MRRRVALLAAATAALACSHGDVFRIVGQGSDQPLAAGTPTRLTYNVQPDTEAAWVPGDSALVYTAFRADHDSDGCVELLPSGGGRAIRSFCEPRPPGEDSTFSEQAAAVSSAGLLAYLRYGKGPVNQFWTVHQLMVRRLDGSGTPRLVETMPAAGAPTHSSVSQIHWLDGDRFVYRADDYQVIFPCRGCPPIDQSFPLFVNLVDLSTDPPAITQVPGTAGVTSLAVQDADAILVTMPNDTHVYRLVLSTGILAPFIDLAPSVPQEIALGGSRLAFASGLMYWMDLPAGTPTPVDSSLGWANPALSSDGKALVVERGRDLWRFALP